MTRKILIWAIMLSGIICVTCTKEDDLGGENQTGSIYGIVTELGTAEPMKAVGVELYKKSNTSKDALLLKTVTFDDGHFEFKDLNPENYQVKVVADGYEQTEEGYISVEAGRQARIDLQVVKQTTHMVVRTIDAIVNSHKVTLNGEFINENGYYPSEIGFVYSTLDNPQDGGTVVKCKVNTTFSTILTDIGAGTYYFQAYARNKGGTAYGEVRSFKVSIPPVIWTKVPTNVLSQTATLNGEIEEEGDPAYTERGFVYSNSYSSPSVDDPAAATTKVTVSGRNKDFSINIFSLTKDTKYYVRAYATTENGTVYGNVQTFTPKATLPSVTTLEATNILPTTATLNGRIDNVGEPAYTERGFVYSTSYQTPTVNDPSTATTKVVVDGSGSNYSTNVSSLAENKTYYVRAYATSEYGTAYGEVLTFKPEIPQYVIVGNLMIQKEDLGQGVISTAFSLCKNSRVAGHSDWRLPTKDELLMMYNARSDIPNLKDGKYWSSTFFGGSDYYYVDFSNGFSSSEWGVHSYYVRAVRTVK